VFSFIFYVSIFKVLNSVVLMWANKEITRAKMKKILFSCKELKINLIGEI